MNFLDPYDVTTTAARTDTPPPGAQPDKSLNEEVSQVLGQLGSFWGGFRKQVSATYEDIIIGILSIIHHHTRVSLPLVLHVKTSQKWFQTHRKS